MTQPRSKEQTMERLSRALKTLSGSNHALLRASDETSLLHDIVNLIVGQSGYAAALVARAEHDERKSITVLAEAGITVAGPSFKASWSADDELGLTATGKAICTGQPCVTNIRADSYPTYWQGFADQRGFASVLSLPLRLEGEIFGALTICAPEPDAFDEQERELLTEAADDLSFGLDTLRIRERRVHADREIARLNRALQIRAGINAALVQASDESTLLHEVCRVAVEKCGYLLAFVRLIGDDAEQTMRTVAYEGVDGIQHSKRTWRGSERDRRVSDALIAGQAWVIKNPKDDPTCPYRAAAQEHDLESMTALPLRVEGELIGNMTIGATEIDAFDESETELLLATVQDLGFGLGALRARARAAAAEETIRRMAYYDAVTGLPNRVKLREMLGDAIASAKDSRRALSLLRVEIEGFRQINETLPEQEVNKLLQEITKKLAQTIGETATLARIPDSEFAILIQGGAEQATQVAHKVVAMLAEPIDLSGLLIDSNASIGISLFPGHGSDPDALIRRASIAQNQAQRSGGGVAIFKGGQDREWAQRLSLMGDLRRAIDRDELLLYCQPKLNMSTGKMCGAEALVRWQHPTLGMLNPGQFIHLAESSGLITPLTYWVLDAALRQSYTWREQGLAQPLSVNLSARDLRDPKLLDRVSGLLATWGAEPDWIEFELTESALMEDPAGALEILHRLKNLDVSLSIDDYGTGYSSLSYLQRLPVDAIKIDQSFVGAMSNNKDSATIVRSTIDLAHNLSLSVIAEGVEDQGTFDSLLGLGCDMAQGYCISRPMPAEQICDWRAPRH